MILCHL